MSHCVKVVVDKEMENCKSYCIDLEGADKFVHSRMEIDMGFFFFFFFGKVIYVGYFYTKRIKDNGERKRAGSSESQNDHKCDRF